MRRVEITPSLRVVLDQLPKTSAWVHEQANPEVLHGQRSSTHLRWGVVRARLGKDVTPHTLRDTALSRMIGAGFDDYTVMEISGHSSTRMLGRYTHPTAARKQGALETFGADLLGQDVGSTPEPVAESKPRLTELLEEIGGRRGDRTPDLCIANAALSQLS
jgi:integrase